MKCEKHNVELVLVSVDDNRNCKCYVCPKCKSDTYSIVKNKG